MMPSGPQGSRVGGRRRHDGTRMTANTPEHDDTRDRAARIIADALTQGLLQAEQMLAAERDRRAQGVPPGTA